MSELFELVSWRDPILKSVAERFDFSSPSLDPESFAKKLIDTMTTKGGVGLAAPQVGLGFQAFAIWSVPPVVIFNPLLVDVSEEKIALDEGCLSYPGLTLNIKRPARIRLRFTNNRGETLTRKFEGLTARIMQHEIEHLQGKTFLGHVSRLKLDLAAKKAQKAGFDYTGIHKCR